ncbi:hypothetical protein K466DRAFT_250916 [Polyporus arcularius HHB13444]|uniref:Uncharacterized protein n=1 Tax=Polyporus arcularius HHB13444 TaxID=1314778 RepID=A0A5C3P648_9APHY|nr:hypothetical protein K466DRAFT_250916 [Polyporus arcularius HHB13444]
MSRVAIFGVACSRPCCLRRHDSACAARLCPECVMGSPSSLARLPLSPSLIPKPNAITASANLSHFLQLLASDRSPLPRTISLTETSRWTSESSNVIDRMIFHNVVVVSKAISPSSRYQVLSRDDGGWDGHLPQLVLSHTVTLSSAQPRF